MPLMKRRSEKAFKHNIEAEMHAGKPQKQALGIAYSVKRKAKKAAGGSVQSGSKDMNMNSGGVVKSGSHDMDYAKGGEVSASNERRPMPDNEYNDSPEVAHNKAKKQLIDSDWDDNPTVKQAQKNNGREVLPIKRPRMVPSDAFSTRLYDEESRLQESDKPGPYGEQPPEHDNEMGAKRQGPMVRDMADEHSTHKKPYKMEVEHDDEMDESEPDMRRSKYAKGGEVE